MRRVLQFAIGRLPTPLQPVARKLAARFFGESETETETALVGEEGVESAEADAAAEGATGDEAAQQADSGSDES